MGNDYDEMELMRGHLQALDRYPVGGIAGRGQVERRTIVHGCCVSACSGFDSGDEWGCL